MANTRTIPEDDHFFRVEVTVAACIATPDDRPLGDNMVDVTLGFSMSASRPLRDYSDTEVNELLTHNISPILAALSVTMTSLGFAALGQIKESMTEGSSPTGEFGKSSPVSIQFRMPDTAQRNRPDA